MEMTRESYLSERLEDQIAYHQRAAGRAKRSHVRLQTAIIVLGALAPILVNMPNLGALAKAAATGISLLLPVLVGIANFRKHGEVWITSRTAEELLKNEKYLFLTQSGPYRGNPAAFPDLVEAVEAILTAEHRKFRSVFDQEKSPKDGAKSAEGKTPGVASGEAKS